MKTVKQVADLTGLSVRSLHHYDTIGLFKPSKYSESGYRLYSDEDLKILQQILFFKELDFPLKEIESIIKNPSFNREKALLNHKNLLTLKRNRLNKLIRLVDKKLKGDDSMSFSEFDVSEIEKLQKEYADEVKEMYGNTDKYKMFQEKTKNYSKSDWANLYEKIEVIFKKFASVMDKGETSEEAQNLVKEWKNFISENLYDCNNETLLGLSKLYIDDKRFTKNIDKHKDGLADFISKSIQIYCK
ncbi:MAG: MerR family transcriptional regulator [Clostridia bacterium]|nr:MerR family transcriptional regulator [Clostridia bacterium]